MADDLDAAIAASLAETEQEQLNEALRISTTLTPAPAPISAFAAAAAAAATSDAEALALASAISVSDERTIGYARGQTEEEQLNEALRLSTTLTPAPARMSAFAAAAGAAATSDADALVLASAISISDERADESAFEAALQASLAEANALSDLRAAALAAEGIPPEAPVPSIVSRQRSRDAYPAFTSVPPDAVLGLSTENELAARLLSDVDPFPAPAVVASEVAPPVDVSDFGADDPPTVAPQTSGDVRALVERLDAEERDARHAADVGPSFACGICLEDAVPLLAGHRLRCGHIYCTPCIGEHVKVKIRSHDVSADALTCPECVATLTVGDVHALTWRCGDDESWHRFEAAADAAMIESLVRDGGACVAHDRTRERSTRAPCCCCCYCCLRCSGRVLSRVCAAAAVRAIGATMHSCGQMATRDTLTARRAAPPSVSRVRALAAA